MKKSQCIHIDTPKISTINQLTDVHEFPWTVDTELASLVDQSDVNFSRAWALWGSDCYRVGTEKLNGMEGVSAVTKVQ